MAPPKDGTELIHVIAQLNPFNTERTEFDTEQKIISEIIKEIDTQKVINTGWRVLIDDEIITDFNRHVPDESTLYIKIVPEGDNKEAGVGMKIGGTFLTVIGVVIAAATSWTGIGAFIGMAMVGAGVGLLAGGVALYNLDIPSLDREQPEQSPSIRGSRNQLRQLGILPYLFGTRRIYADLAATSYTWVDSNGDQYLYQLFCAGQKDIEIDKTTIKVGDTLLENYTSGTIESILDGTDPLIHMQISHGADLPPLVTTCVHEEQKNAIVKNKAEDGIDGSVVWTTPSDTEEINVDIFFYNGLGKYNDDNDVVSTSVSVTAKYKRADEDDSKYQTLGFFSGSSSTISGSELKTKRYAIHKKGLAAGQYTIKISRETADSEDNKVIDAVYVGSFRAIKNTPPVSKATCQKITLIGLKIKASEKLNSVIEQLNFIASAKMPIYDYSQSGASSWKNTVVTANPAACALAVMRSEFSQQKLSDKDIDWQRFADWYTWCDNHGYTCNEYITQSMAISEILSAIASTSRGEILRYNGRITVIQDIARSAAVQLFTPRNSHDYAESIQFADIPDAMAIGFVDKESGFAENELTIYNTPSGNKTKEPETTQDITLWGVTDSVQARKLGMYKYAVSKNRPVVYKFSCDIEYLLCTKGDWIKYAGDVALAGIKQGRIVSVIIDDTGSCTGFTSDEILPMEADKNYACRIRKNTGEIILVQLITAEGSTSNVTFAAPLIGEVIHAGDLFAFGIVGNETIDLIITDIQCGDDLSATITAVDYAPDIFGVDDPGFILPEYKNKISDVPGAVDSGNITDWQTWYTFNDSATQPSRPSGDGTNDGWHRIPTAQALWQSSKTAKSITDGQWSEPVATAANIDDKYQTGEGITGPDIPLNLAASASRDGIDAICTINARGQNNVLSSIVWEFSRDEGKTWAVYETKSTAWSYTFNRRSDGYPEATELEKWRVRVKAVNLYGKESDYAGGDEGYPINTANYGTWLLKPVNIAAAASKDEIVITIDNSRNVDVYGTARYEVAVNGKIAGTTNTERYIYYFDRKIDGYPERIDLTAYEIGVTVHNEASSAHSNISGTEIDMTEYKTWLTPPVAIEGCVAKEDGIYNEWTADESLTFGSIRYRLAIYYDRDANPEPIACKESAVQPSYTYLFNRNTDADGYPETADTIAQLAALGLPIRGRTLDLYSLEVTAYTLERPDVTETETAAILTDYYGTWVPPAVEAVRAEASRDAVHIEITDTVQPTHYGTPYSYIIELKKGDASDWQRVYFGGTVYDWPIDRTADGYPERIDLDDWRVRVKSVSTAKNESFYWGGTEAGAAVGTSGYGTWLIETPAVQVTVSGRSITLAMQQPPRAGNIEQYGSIRYRLQIQKPEESEAWKKPAQNLNPYTSEDNWQDGEGSITVGDVYTQTMPLTGQTLKDVVVEGETVQQSAPVSTLYRFLVVAFSEAAESAGTEVNATALATGIQDIVQGSVTHDKISTPSLAAISANMGVISSGGFSGSALNYWYLSTIMGQLGVADRYEGSMRVGGEDEYLLVEPIVAQGRVIKYKIVFKVGNFEVSSEASRVNGELVVMENASSLDRTRITPIGTYYEHRETSDSEQWRAVSQMRTDGIRANSLYSEQTLVITNATLQDRRLRKRDVGRPYLSASSRVWHFDTDLLDQYQKPGLEVSSIGDVVFADQYNMAGSDIDFTPAILAVAPYSEIGRSAYGQFNASIELSATNNVTVDLWVEYIWTENQVLFDIGNDIDRIKLVIANEEPYLNDYSPDRDEAPLNAEMLMPGDVVVLNEPAYASTTIQHYGNTVPVPDPSHVRTFDELGIEFTRNTWLHVGIILSPDTIGCYLNKTQVTFDRYSAAAAPVRVMLNELRNTFILDELYIDTEVTESFADFAANTDARIPWGALDKDKKYFILEAENLLTNIFDTDEFKAKVKELIEEAQS